MSEVLKDAIEDYIAAHGGGDGAYPTEIGALTLMRSTTEALPNPMIYRPALCVVAQGAKQILFGERLFDYAALQCLVISLTLPAFGRVTRASPEKPLLALNLDFDLGILQEVMAALEPPPPASTAADFGVFVGNLDAALSECLSRLVRLLATPAAIRVLYPGLVREIYYGLLTGPHGGDIGKLVLPNSHTQRVARAIRLLRERYASPIRVADLAAAAGMSASSFHQHFKALTSMTPLQYQKQLRLLEARRLLLADGANVAHAAYRVGYESASQFSREYARMFGQPPKRDATELKTHPAPA